MEPEQLVSNDLPTVLLIDDDLPASNALIRALQRKGAACSFVCASNEAEARKLAQDLQPEAVVLDLSLNPLRGPESGLSLITELQELIPIVRVLVLTGHGAEEFGIRALQLGAASFLQKPADPVHLLALLNDAIAYSRLKRSYLQLSSTPDNLLKATGLSSQNKKMQKVIEAVAYSASNRQPVLLLGETGVGKGVIARAIHGVENTSRSRFIRFQPTFGGHDLVSSELFGHKKGAFTGANEDRRGLLEEADHGTLFIDEVAELPQETQIMLLEALQEKLFRRMGSNKEILSNFRLITATNRSLQEIKGQKLLRTDFYHRIAHFTIEIPPLRERPEDVLSLAETFITALTNRERLKVQGLTKEAGQKLANHSWPGNVRELQAVVEGGVYKANYLSRRFIEAVDLTINREQSAAITDLNALSFRDKVRMYELKLVQEALQQNQNNQTLAAQSLNLDRTSFRRILKRSED